MNIGVGDPVEVLKPKRLEGGGIGEATIPATVCSYGGGAIGVAYADGTREAFPIESRHVRVPVALPQPPEVK